MPLIMYCNGNAEAGTPGGTPHTYWRLLMLADQGVAGGTNHFIDIAELQFRGTVGGGNLATGGTALESGHFSTGDKTQAFDSNNATRWAAPGSVANEWLGYQFAAPTAINEVAITNFNSNPDSKTYSPVLFIVQSSDDGSTWTFEWLVNVNNGVVNGTGWSTTGQTKSFARQDYDAPDVVSSHRYWRVRGYATTGNTFFSLSEIEMRATPSGADQTGSGTAIGTGPFNADASLTMAKAYDNNTGTRWASLQPPMQGWCGYDFGSGQDKVVQEFSMQGFSSGEYPQDFSLDYSDDGTNWVVAAVHLHCTTWSSGVARQFATTDLLTIHGS